MPFGVDAARALDHDRGDDGACQDDCLCPRSEGEAERYREDELSAESRPLEGPDECEHEEQEDGIEDRLRHHEPRIDEPRGHDREPGHEMGERA